MKDKNRIEQLADTMIGLAMRYKKEENNRAILMNVLRGKDQFLLETRPNAGHDFKYILDAIYRYYKKYPEDKIEEYLYDTFINFAKIAFNISNVNNFLNMYLFQIESQKRGISPFEIDMVSVLNELRNTIYKANLNKDVEYMNVVNRFDKYFESDLGHKIL